MEGSNLCPLCLPCFITRLARLLRACGPARWAFCDVPRCPGASSFLALGQDSLCLTWPLALLATLGRYATLASIGGLSPTEIVDERAARAGLPPVDSIDQSSHLLGPGWRLEAQQRRMDFFASQSDSSGIEGPLAVSAPAERVLEAEVGPGRSSRSSYSSPPRSEVALGSCANIRKDVFCQGDDPGELASPVDPLCCQLSHCASRGLALKLASRPIGLQVARPSLGW